ncbi:hypothetical protein [Novosphingobium olei]|uniref:hypothetical protein n=1 Tax=Novosphingobium olei TaxID=2728851 RepID=UPI003092A36F|nr:DUF4873 domain-containing protein [Novosphingobium olei]
MTIRRPLPLLAALALVATASPALADAPATKLVRCGAADCLLVKGNRADPKSPVTINDHAVPVEGGRHWSARLPVATVRAWTEPCARTLSVAVADEAFEARLPVGMLGTPKDLAMLVVRAK